jgi:hypothetical protein
MIAGTFLKYKSGEIVDFDEASQVLFEWSKKWIKSDCIRIYPKASARSIGDFEPAEGV